MKPSPHEDDEEVVPIRLDRETLVRLARFGRDVGKHPTVVAGELLRDLLIDDESAHQVLN